MKLALLLIVACGPGPFADPLGKDHVITELTPLAFRGGSAFFAYPYDDDERVPITLYDCANCLDGPALYTLDPLPAHQVVEFPIDRHLFDGRTVTISALRGDRRVNLSITLDRLRLPDAIPVITDTAFLSSQDGTIYSLPTIVDLQPGFYKLVLRVNDQHDVYCTEGCRVTATNQIELISGTPTVYVIDTQDEPYLYGYYRLP